MMDGLDRQILHTTGHPRGCHIEHRLDVALLLILREFAGCVASLSGPVRGAWRWPTAVVCACCQILRFESRRSIARFETR